MAALATQKAGARIAHARMRNDPEALLAAQQELTEARVVDAIEKALVADPPLTSESKRRLAALLCA